mgnify:CR=1 FL=1
MADVHSPDVRRKNMQAIKGRNTKPEIKLRKLLFNAGYRYRVIVKCGVWHPQAASCF